MLNIFGRTGQNPEIVLSRILPKYKLHYSLIQEKEIPDIIRKSQVCISSFYLDGKQWFNFSQFFQNPKTKTNAITAKDLLKPNPPGIVSESGGHSVVLVDFHDDVYTFLNSWGQNWGDKGYFRVQKGAIKFKFLHVYWYESDLSPKEKEIWNQKYNNFKTRLNDLLNSIPSKLEAAEQNLTHEEYQNFDGLEALRLLFQIHHTEHLNPSVFFGIVFMYHYLQEFNKQGKKPTYLLTGLKIYPQLFQDFKQIVDDFISI